MSGGQSGQSAWAASWTASPQKPGTGFVPNWSEEGFADQTIRQTVRLSLGGDALRVRLSNRYGTTALKVGGLSVAAPVGGAAVKPDTVRTVTVGGEAVFTVPAGGEVATDSVPLPAEALDAVTVTLYLSEPSGPATYHAQALATTYRASGDQRGDSDGAVFTETSGSWYFLGGVDVAVAGAALRRDGIVVLGDSLVDGTGGTPDTDRRFTDLLARRLVAAGRPRAVLNQGIGGNRVTIDSPWLGERATARFDADVLSQPGVGTMVILAGINDVCISELAADSPFPVLAPYTEVAAEEVVAGLRDLIRRSHGAGLRVVGVTLLPVRGSGFSTTRSEAKRSAVNAWIRGSREFDAVIDLAAVMGDTLDPAYDSGDQLHPNDVGYAAMAEAVDLSVL